MFSVVDILLEGYQYPPVLTEKELLTVQSPDYCANIFKNSVEDISVFLNSSREVSYSFKTVAAVNAFLFEVTSRKELRTLGELKKNSQSLLLKPRQGYFVLKASNDDLLALERAGEKYQFKVSTNSQLVELKFDDKLEMFKFLVSDPAKDLRVLAFDQSQISNKFKDPISNNLRRI